MGNSRKVGLMIPKKIALLAVMLCLSGCATEGGGDDLSWLGGVIGAILGFGLFFLVSYLSAKNRL